MRDNESEQYPEEDIPDDEEDDDEEDEDDDPDDGDYKVSPLYFSKVCWMTTFYFSKSLLSVFDMQSPPTVQTQEKKDDEDEGTMPPYDQETQNLIDGKCVWKWLTQPVLSY